MILQATHWKPLSAALGLLAAAALLTQHAHVRAQESDEVVTIQARLTQGGAPLSATGLDFVLQVYTASAGGVLLYEEDQTGIDVTNGLLSVQLGSGAPTANGPFQALKPAFAPSAAPSTDRYVAILLGGQEVVQRIKLTAVPYAMSAENAGSAARAATVVDPADPTATALTAADLAAVRALLFPAASPGNGQLLTWSGGAPQWAAPAPTLPPGGQNGQVLMISGGVPTWVTPAPAAVKTHMFTVSWDGTTTLHRETIPFSGRAAIFVWAGYDTGVGSSHTPGMSIGVAHRRAIDGSPKNAGAVGMSVGPGNSIRGSSTVAGGAVGGWSVAVEDCDFHTNFLAFLQVNEFTDSTLTVQPGRAIHGRLYVLVIG